MNPTQIPTMPPITPKIIDENESSLAPHNIGKKLPRTEPTVIPIQISFFESTERLYHNVKHKKTKPRKIASIFNFINLIEYRRREKVKKTLQN